MSTVLTKFAPVNMPRYGPSSTRSSSLIVFRENLAIVQNKVCKVSDIPDQPASCIVACPMSCCRGG
eukprot:m.202206 g.202206  ORF g.202206 m.202206 type:complete len:66 (+) comp14976_c2_seq1:233-430(+)